MTVTLEAIASNNLVDVHIPMPTTLGADEANAILRRAQAFPVTDKESYIMGSDMLDSVKKRWAAMEKERKHQKEPLDEAVTRVQAFWKNLMNPLKLAEDALKLSLTKYDTEQRRVATEAQRKADDAAEAERQRIEAEAAEKRRQAHAEEQRRAREIAEQRVSEERAKREAAEAIAAIERAKRQAAEAAAAGDKLAADKAERAGKEARERAIQAEMDRQKAEDDAAASQARSEQLARQASAEAQALDAQASMVLAPTVHAQTVAIPGQFVSTSWDYELVDIKQVNPDYLVLNDKAVGALVRSMKEGAARVVGGIRVFPVQSMTKRTK